LLGDAILNAIVDNYDLQCDSSIIYTDLVTKKTSSSSSSGAGDDAFDISTRLYTCYPEDWEMDGLEGFEVSLLQGLCDLPVSSRLSLQAGHGPWAMGQEGCRLLPLSSALMSVRVLTESRARRARTDMPAAASLRAVRGCRGAPCPQLT
jgi:hypothetical protein